MMVENTIETAIVPYNQSMMSVVQKDKFQLFAPLASDTQVGVAKYDPEHFSVVDKTVTFSASVLSWKYRVDDDIKNIGEYISDYGNRIQTTEEDVENLENEVERLDIDIKELGKINANLDDYVKKNYMRRPPVGTPVRIPAVFPADEHHPSGRDGYYEMTNYNAPGAIVPMTSNPAYGNSDKGGFYSCTTPQGPYHTANKKYVDDEIFTKLQEELYGLSMFLGFDPTTGYLIFELRNKDNKSITGAAVDLPVEEMVVDVSVEVNPDDNKTYFIFHLLGGMVRPVPVADIVQGLASQTWVTSMLAGKADKVVSSAIGTRVRVYYEERDANGNRKEGDMRVNTSNVKNAIPVYTTGGGTASHPDNAKLVTGDCVQPYHAAPKKYVDEQIQTYLGHPIAIATAAEMDNVLTNAVDTNVGAIYQYTGETTDNYTNGEFYRLENA